jgi:dTDP-4-dehydrorhamnose reductase
LAEVILDLGRLDAFGIYHASGSGQTTWYDFALTILERARHTIDRPERISIKPITAAEFGRPAPRPAYSVFDTSKLSQTLGRTPIDWQRGLNAHLMDIGILERKL